MKQLLYTRCLVLLTFCSLSITAFAQQNLVANGDFESRNQAPQALDNIGPTSPTHPSADLQDWYRTPTPTSADPLTNYPDYVATDGAPAVNPATYFQANLNYSFAPHGGKGCVVLYQHDFNGDHRYNSIITRDLGTALTAGHTYQVEYWVRRLASNNYRTQLGLYLTNSAPTFEADYDIFSNTFSYNFSPPAGNKALLSGDIRDTQNWTRVSGTITPTDAGNRWLTIGYASTGQQYDPSITQYNVPGIYYAIDDVSITDMGPACPTNLTLTAYANGQQLGDVSQPNQGSSGEVNIYTPVTFAVAGNNVGTINWSVYTSTGPNSYTSSTYGNTFTITPREPQSTTWPGGATNGAQYYGITCTVTYPGCATSSSLEFGLYSNPTGGPDGGGDGSPNLGYRSAGTTCAYPNPANESITIPVGIERATLVNEKGKTLRTADASGKLDVQSLTEGLYNLQMMQDGKLINQRMQVKH